MVYSAMVNSNYRTFNEILEYFSRKYFNTIDIKVGKKFLRDFGNYIESKKVSCDKITLHAFIGYQNRFGLALTFNNVDIAYLEIEVKDNDIINLYNYSYEHDCFKSMYHEIFEGYFKTHNSLVFNEWLTKCNIKNDDSNEVIMLDYNNFNLTKEVAVSGTLEEIFDRYTTHNDRLRYCNGCHWSFKDKNMKVLYRIFINNYNGNYFLDNAVKRGCIID